MVSTVNFWWSQQQNGDISKFFLISFIQDGCIIDEKTRLLPLASHEKIGGVGQNLSPMGKTFKNITNGVKILHFYILLLLSLTSNIFSGKYSPRKDRNLFLKFYHFSLLVFSPGKFFPNKYYFSLMISRTKQRFKRNTWHYVILL